MGHTNRTHTSDDRSKNECTRKRTRTRPPSWRKQRKRRKRECECDGKGKGKVPRGAWRTKKTRRYERDHGSNDNGFSARCLRRIPRTETEDQPRGERSSSRPREPGRRQREKQLGIRAEHERDRSERSHEELERPAGQRNQ